MLPRVGCDVVERAGTKVGRLVAAARQTLLPPEAGVARQVLSADLALLDSLDGQIAAVDQRITTLAPATVYGVLTSGPGWGAGARCRLRRRVG